MDDVEDWPTRRDRLFEQARKQQRRDDRFATLGMLVIAATDIGWVIRGGEVGFRSAVVTLLSVIAICAARGRR